MTNFDQVLSEDELIKAFRLRDQKHVELPKKATFPVKFEHYLTWGEAAGHYRYLLFRMPKTKELKGVVFRRDRGDQTPHASLCDWCHAYGSSEQIDLMTVRQTAKTTIGLILCTDLSCIQNIETSGRLSRKTHDELAETLMSKIARFYENNLDPSAI